ncbi:DegV family protein [Christensenellaceae bacterium OttesenSCG-928-M15]|nr:DegV family protein [Christensenellaceae bacterium OttesenSCG-928-M15]
MRNQIIVDSCCDMPPEMKRKMGIISVPLTMMLGEREFRDDETLNIDEFMTLVKQYSGKTGSASPAPYLYQDAIESADTAYVVTLSNKLSGSYSHAVIGNNEAVENGAASACIFDSKSASAGETLTAIKIHELIAADTPKEQIAEIMHRFIDSMKTYFVLENYDNLQKNGRLSKVTGSLIQMLNIRLVMGADGKGEIALFEKCRGIRRVLGQLLSLIESSGKETQGENLVISHCNNRAMAEQLGALIQDRFNFKKIYVVPTGGLSSLYADDKGIVMAF